MALVSMELIQILQGQPKLFQIFNISDYDFIIVLDSYVGPLLKPECPSSPYLSSEVVVTGKLKDGLQVDITCIHFDYWEALLKV
jgi:hypothetical protein